MLGGDVCQETTWTSRSGTDNGSYTGTFSDTGSTTLFMTAKRGTVVQAVRGDDPTLGMVLADLKFSGVMHQDGDFTNDWTPDQSPPPAWCGPATGSLCDPPSTADCGARDSSANKTARSPGNLYYHDANDHDGDRTVTVHWELKLKRLG